MSYVIEISSSGHFVGYFERGGGLNLIFDREAQAREYIQQIEANCFVISWWAGFETHNPSYDYRAVPNPNEETA